MLKKITKWKPDDFELEMTTHWSFPKRGDWATHDAKWRGNWSPYIPRNIILRYSKEGDLVLDQFAGGVEYVINKNNNAEAGRRYNTSRQQVQIWRNKYYGNVRSIVNQSRRPYIHPKQHTRDELNLIQQKYQRHKHERLGQVYRKCIEVGYKRSYGAMCKQLTKMKNYKKPKKLSYPKSKYKLLKGKYIGEYIQVDVKFEPLECMGFKSNYERYYQITVIDLYSRKIVLKLV